MFNKLQNKLVLAFSVIIGSMLFLTIYVWRSESVLLNQYEDLTTNLLTIYELNNLTDSLINNYLNRIRQVDNTELADEYISINSNINQNFSSLEKNIKEDKSLASFIGLEKILESIQENCNTGIAAAEKGELVTSFSIYDDISRQKAYVKDNISALIFNQLEQTQTIHEQILKNTQRNLIIQISMSSVIVILCIILSIVLARSMTTPLSLLKSHTKEISKGNFSFKIKDNLLRSGDEVGILARSFDQMKDELSNHVSKLNKSNEEMKKIKDDIEIKNKKLQRLNDTMVGRELKLIELKKKIQKLEERSKST
jgi:methyl-accepting chemotaxis protein